MNKHKKPQRAVIITLSMFIVMLLGAGSVLAFDGLPLWDWNHGVQISSSVSPGTLNSYQPVPDKLGGTYVTYLQVVNLTPIWNVFNAEVRVKLLDEDGVTLWSIPVANNSLDHSWSPVACADGYGNVIVAWVEGPLDIPIDPLKSFGTGYEVHAQKISSSGVRLWTGDAVLSSKYNSDLFSLSLKICPDGTGGAFIGWGSRLTYVSRDANVPGGLNGIELIPGGSGNYKFIYDGTGYSYITPPPNPQRVWVPGGVYAAWTDGTGSLIGQRVNAGTQWGTNGEQIAQFLTMGNFEMALDNSGDLLTCYMGTPTASTNVQIRAQKLNRDGTKDWNTDGMMVFNAADTGGDWPTAGGNVAITTDDSGGAIIAWQDHRRMPAGHIDLYAQRLNSSGSKMWYNEILLPPYTVGDTAPGDQGMPRIVPDGAQGAVVVYQDKGGWSWDIAATRVAGSGLRLWSQWVRFDGSDSSDPGLDQTGPRIAYDQWGTPEGVFIVWLESDSSHKRIFAEKVEVNSDPPINDDCSNATVAWPGNNLMGAVAWATNDGSAGCGDSSSSADAWYKITPTFSGVLNVNTCGSNDIGGEDNGMDTVLSLHSSCPGSSGNQLNCNDDWISAGTPINACDGVDEGTDTRDSAVSTAVTKNQTYYIRVSHFGSSNPGQFRLNLEQLPFECDIDEDGDVDGKDLSEFNGYYPGDIRADLNNDGTVNQVDMAMCADQLGRI
jgi:hypothetical protein